MLVHLMDDEADAFVARYRAALRRAYVPEADGRTHCPLRRIFIVAEEGVSRFEPTPLKLISGAAVGCRAGMSAAPVLER